MIEVLSYLMFYVLFVRVVLQVGFSTPPPFGHPLKRGTRKAAENLRPVGVPLLRGSKGFPTGLVLRAQKYKINSFNEKKVKNFLKKIKKRTPNGVLVFEGI